MNKILNLKNWFLEKDLVIENEYLDKYLNLLTSNLDTESKKSITQLHHAIPVIYYKQTSAIEWNTRSRHKYEKLAKEDQNNFLVNLKYSDHLLAHCYLALCAKPDWFKFANANMITVVSKYTNLEEFVSCEDLEVYQEAYTLSCKLKEGKTLTEEHKRKIAASHNRSPEYSKKIAEANSRRVWTEKSKKKLSISIKENKERLEAIKVRNKTTPPAKGLIWVTNGLVNTRIKENTLIQYLSNGYWKGRTRKK